MSLTCRWHTSRQDEALSLGQPAHQFVDSTFQYLYLPLSQMSGGIERRLTLICGQMGTDIEKVVLHPNDEITFLIIFHHGHKHTQMGTQFIDCAIGL
jgi:hypothetical protein